MGSEVHSLHGGDGADTATLVRLSRAGDRAAFTTLVARYKDGVFGHLLTRCGDPGRAEEAAQDAFVTAFTTLERLQKPASFRSWVIGIGINMLRRRRREVANLELLSAQGSGGDGQLAAMEGRERLEAIRQAVDELPENYRAALIMHYFERRRGRAIGTELGISEGAVHMLLLRARKALAEKLKDFDPGRD